MTTIIVLGILNVLLLGLFVLFVWKVYMPLYYAVITTIHPGIQPSLKPLKPKNHVDYLEELLKKQKKYDDFLMRGHGTEEETGEFLDEEMHPTQQ